MIMTEVIIIAGHHDDRDVIILLVPSLRWRSLLGPSIHVGGCVIIMREMRISVSNVFHRYEYGHGIV